MFVKSGEGGDGDLGAGERGEGAAESGERERGEREIERELIQMRRGKRMRERGGGRENKVKNISKMKNQTIGIP